MLLNIIIIKNTLLFKAIFISFFKMEEENIKADENIKEEVSLKEKRIRELTQIYYSRADIRKAIFEFSFNRECIPRYFEGFGKRPDKFQYESDIFEFVKKGATSFHCSEELWQDPLEISTNLKPEETDNLRTGWDLLLDVDSPYLDFSKIYANLLIETLKFHGVKNIGVKFSVSGDTPVLIRLDEDIKLIPISDVIELIKQGKNIEILSLDRYKKLAFSKVYNFLEHKDDLYEIYHAQSKIPVKATRHHSVFVWNKGEIIQKKVEDIKEGDFLISFNSINNFLESEEIEVENIFELNKNQFSTSSFNKKIKITPELMRLIGYFLAEGHVTNIINQVGFTFNKNETEYVEDVKSILSLLTGKKISIRHPNPNSTQVLIHSKEWATFFDKFCGKKKDKHLPSFSWNLTKKLFLEMLKGYIRGDGYKKGEYNIVIKSVSVKLITELVWLCKLKGISCSLNEEYNKPHVLPQGTLFKGSHVFIITIPKSELFQEFFRIRNKFSPFPRDRTFPVDGLIQVYHQIQPKMFNYHRPEQMALKKKCANLTRIRRVLEWFSRYKSNEPDTESEKIISNYNSLFSSDIGVVEIKRIIKKNSEEVFDVSVEQTEAFFGNYYPILLHNSGSKGFHILVPWKAFPKKIYGQETKNMFPEWPRIICSYLSSIVKPKLEAEIFSKEMVKKIAEKTGQQEKEMMIKECSRCNNPADRRFLIRWYCPYCKNEIQNIEGSFKRKPRCPDCRKELLELSRKEIFVCRHCKINSQKNPEFFRQKERLRTEQFIDADLVLVSPRHLFRMPYSLHEKTSLSSIVIDKDKIKDFQIQDAIALKAKPKPFMPNSVENEAKNLLLQALDWKENQEKNSKKIVRGNEKLEIEFKIETTKDKKFKEIIITNLTDDLFPPCIKKLLQGQKQDGRKRALFLLLSFFRALKLDEQKIKAYLEEWNAKNYQPLPKAYITSQLNWYLKNPVRLPPNCDKQNYKELSVCTPDEICELIKNPVNYVIKKYLKK